MSERITLGHGSGGELTGKLVEEIFIASYGGCRVRRLEDSAIIDGLSGGAAFTTDAFVVRPLFFPGGDIGKLAVFGTCNDLAVAGARPRFLSISFVLEEGLLLDDLRRVCESIGEAAGLCGVEIVAGDTKVVERGAADGLYISCAGIGTLLAEGLGPEAIRPGDAIVVSGPIGDHGSCIAVARGMLKLAGDVSSDCGFVGPAAEALLGLGVRMMRDPTRGGLATVVVEMARASGLGARLDEAAVPVSRQTASVCDILGFDPLYLACEGRLVAVVPADRADAAVAVLRSFNGEAAAIGQFTEGKPRVVLATRVGGQRIVDKLAADQLPRIC
ncbi:MAG TPA: hydrogenase expression/formation protein HypE [Alphaproteobacteria bacterium]|nr:hydrogenase expression/formation protein HypE [Alphaproteobacteria bacterium]